MNARILLQESIVSLKQAGCESPRLDAEVLLMWAWGITPTQLIIRSQDEVPEAVQQKFEDAMKQRCQRQPIAYITGEKEFWSRAFEVNESVLVPRPETEHLIEEVLQAYPNQHAPYHFADVGTGSGCIAVTLACEYPHALILATDISEQALIVAERNAEKHGVAARIQFSQGSVYDAFPEPLEPLDAIVSNPPYLSIQHMDDIAEELNHEPGMALTDGQDGLSILRELLMNAPRYLKPDGYCVVETGLAGLPDTPEHLTLRHAYHDLAGHLRGGVYQLLVSRISSSNAAMP